MGVGVIHHFLGDLDEAVRELSETMAIARGDEDHFRASVSLTHLAMIALERGEWSLAIARAAELTAIAEKLGDGSEGPFARATEAIARRRAGEAEADRLVEVALANLRAIDSKGHLAYALTHAAEIDLSEGDHANAARRAQEALAAACTVNRASEAAVARCLLGRAAFAAGRRKEAAERLRSVSGDLRQPGLVSARAHGAAASLAVALGASLPLGSSV
jgi:ATP/maltotriose-dependent transcriptional regulator MalT